MDLLQGIGDFFYGATRVIERSLTFALGTSNERRVRQIGYIRDRRSGTSRIVPGSFLDRVNQLEASLQAMSDDELRQTTPRLRARLLAGETLDQVAPDAFAAVREAGRRFLRMRHFDVQIIGGYVLNQGMIAEMSTGEGKTLVATLPAFLNALAGKVHVITVNDYLARRDMEWMGAIYQGLGLTVGAIQSHMPSAERQLQYACDITYGTNNEFGFDYLRDNMKPRREDQVQGRLDFALIDEVDNILIDEARTPLIISGSAHDDVAKYPMADKVARQLKKGVDFELKEKEHTCHLTEEGIRNAERIAGVESFYTQGNMHWPHLIDNALKAHHLYLRDVNYVVERGEVVIIDEHTGRKMQGRQWSDGLHQAVEAKEGVRVKEETQTLATITLQNYFKLYKKLAGMTGTAMTESEEFWRIYKLDVVNIPPNRQNRRKDAPDAIYRSEREKWNAVIEEVKAVHATGRPVLVGTISIEKSELVSNLLKQEGINHNLLNAKFHEREAEIISQAGRLNAVTISTNMAGRGTDIILGGNSEYPAWQELGKHFATRLDVPKSVWDETCDRIAKTEGMVEEGRKVAELGGLAVIGTERHDSRRIDLQLRGRAARQGDPGSSRFFISLEDNLMRIFMGDWVKNLLTSLGMQDGEAIESKMVTNRIQAAQKKVEERHFDIRKNLIEYDGVMDKQRKEIYALRQSILEGASIRALIVDQISDQIRRNATRILDPKFRWSTIVEWAQQEHHIFTSIRDIEGMNQQQLDEFLKSDARRRADEDIEDKLNETHPVGADERDWNWQALANWSNSTYRTSFDAKQLREIGRDNLHTTIYAAASDSISEFDLSLLEVFLDDDFCVRAYVDWVGRQYGFELTLDDLSSRELEWVINITEKRAHDFYRFKEAQFPITVSTAMFMVQDGPESFRVDAEKLIAWAKTRLKLDLKIDDIVGKNYGELMNLLLDASRRYLETGDSISTLDDKLDAAFGPRYGKAPDKDRLRFREAAKQIVEWANREFAAELEVEDFEDSTRGQIRQLILKAHARKYRSELHHTERLLLLDFLDSAWKEHLYYMDHLRSQVGFAGYAQKDPKVEYAIEGAKAFADMKQRIGDQVTANIFRIEQSLTADYVSSLWNITEETHAEVEAIAAAATAPEQPAASSSNSSDAAKTDEVPAVETIRDRGQRVGRNDPCPCGSGRKYKKCCGQNM